MTLATDKRWRQAGQKLHERMKRAYNRRYQRPEVLAEGLAEIERLELYKDMGYDSFRQYAFKRWGPWARSIIAWARLGDVFRRVPDLFKLCAPGHVSLEKISWAADLIDTKEDALWWGRLSRLTHTQEYKSLVAATAATRRCGHPTPQAKAIIGWVDQETYDRVVAPALAAARESLDTYTQVGDAIAWVCAACLGKSLPGPLGADNPDPWDASTVAAYASGRDPVEKKRKEKNRYDARLRARKREQADSDGGAA